MWPLAAAYFLACVSCSAAVAGKWRPGVNLSRSRARAPIPRSVDDQSVLQKRYGSPYAAPHRLMHYVVTATRSFGGGGKKGGSKRKPNDVNDFGDDGTPAPVAGRTRIGSPCKGNEVYSSDCVLVRLLAGAHLKLQYPEACGAFTTRIHNVYAYSVSQTPDNAVCAVIDNAICADGLCACSTDFVSLADIACVRSASFLGDSCVISAQCSGVAPNAICYKDRCICEPHYFVAVQSCQVEPPSVSDQYASMPILSSGTLTRKPSSSSRGAVACERKLTLDDRCCDAKQCSYSVWHSTCDSRSGVCECNFGYVPIGSHSCARKAEQLGDKCSVDSQCQDISGSECTPGGYCWCILGQTVARDDVVVRRSRQLSGNVCLDVVNLGDPCEIDAQCNNRTRFSKCEGSTCVCDSGFVSREPSVNECLPLVPTLGKDNCTTSAQCTASGAICNRTTDTCDCNSALYCNIDDKCESMKRLDDSCLDVCQCNTAKALCVSGKCRCPSGKAFQSLNDTCMDLTLHFSRTSYSFFDQYCCQNNVSAAQRVGTVGISRSSLETSFTFSVTSSDFSIDAQTGVISLSAGKMLMTTVSLTVTAQSATNPDLTDMAEVVFNPDGCCVNGPTLRTSTIGLTLEDSTVATPGSGCNGVGQAQTANNAAGIIDLDNESVRMLNMDFPIPNGLWVQPCRGGLTTIRLSGLMITSGACTGDSSTGQINWNGATADVRGMTVTCVVSGVASGCNAVGRAFQINLGITGGTDC